MDYKKIITGLLSKAYKLDDGEITALLESGDTTEDAALTAILEKDTTRVAAIKKATDTEGKFQEGYKKAKKEERTAFEAELKTKLGIESDLTGVELVEHIVSTKEAEASKGKKGEITEEDVKKHPVYQGLDTRFKRELKAKDEEWKTKLETVETTFKKKETFADIKVTALNLLDGLKPVLPGSTEVATTLKNVFVGALEGYEFDKQGDKTIVMKDGKVVEDQHGHSMTLDELVKTTAPKYFEFQKNNGGANPAGGGNQNPQGGGATYPAGIAKPKSIEDLEKIMNDSNVKTEDKQIVMETYERENPNG
jgi:hypothetical protein